jgi:hypothetical protein
MATHTPWGPSQTSHEHAPGIVFHSTAGHGGFQVTATLNATIPPHLRIPDGWYEEDCDAARVILAFPQHFDADVREAAERTLRAYFPEAWESQYRRALLPGESRTKDQRAWHAAHTSDLVVIAAWGDWHPQVPSGMVGVVARAGGRSMTGPDHYFLVSQLEYHAPREFGFIIDPTRHQRVGPIR